MICESCNEVVNFGYFYLGEFLCKVCYEDVNELIQVMCDITA